MNVSDEPVPQESVAEWQADRAMSGWTKACCQVAAIVTDWKVLKVLGLRNSEGLHPHAIKNQQSSSDQAEATQSSVLYARGQIFPFAPRGCINPLVGHSPPLSVCHC